MAVASLPRRETRGALLPEGWPLYLLFGLYPLWWLLGLSAFVWPVLAAPMAASLLMRDRVRAPRGFGLWLLFLAFMLVSGTQLDDPDRVMLFGYRSALYVSATIVFLYIYNAPEALRPARIAGLLAVYGGTVVLGGFLGLLAPSLSFHSPVESFLPGAFLADPWFHDMVHVTAANQVELFETPRPSAPFPYTNQWGSNLVLAAPFLIALAPGRRLPRLLLVGAIVPLIVSLNRGAWVALALGLLYAGFRLGLQGRGRALARVVTVFVAAVIALTLTPLGEVFQERLATPHSNEGRFDLYEQARDEAVESPLLGFGATIPSQEGLPAVGTHGQIWMILVSHGIPAAFLFLAWFAVVLWRTRGARSEVGFWSNVAVFIALVQVSYYGMLPAQIHLLMAAAALAWHEQVRVESRRATERVR
jgi:polysaccharide biosynthesis protein PslJ